MIQQCVNNVSTRQIFCRAATNKVDTKKTIVDTMLKVCCASNPNPNGHHLNNSTIQQLKIDFQCIDMQFSRLMLYIVIYPISTVVPHL